MIAADPAIEGAATAASNGAAAAASAAKHAIEAALTP